MSDLFRIGTSALMTYQQSLSTAAHNVANVNTPGYSRQSVELSTQRPDSMGGMYLGNGVQASAVRRAYDEFVVDQVRTSQSAFKHQETYMEMAQQVDSLLGDTETSLAAGLQDFFNAAQEVADDPTSSAARQVMLTEGQSLASRFHRLDQGLNDLGERINGQIHSTVDEINSMAAGIADLNDDIAVASSRGGGQPPSDLLDQRDALLEELSQRIAVSLIPQDSGAVNVFVGSGQPLVLENQASTLSTVPQDQDPTHLEITATGSSGDLVITDRITGGQLGGLLEMRDQVLKPSQNALGRIGIGLAAVFNQQHQKGIDLNGELGEDFFTVPQPQVTPNSDNTGSGPVVVSLNDASQLTTDDYQLSFDGGVVSD